MKNGAIGLMRIPSHIDFSIERKMADTKGQNTSMTSELSSM